MYSDLSIYVPPSPPFIDTLNNDIIITLIRLYTL